MQVVQRNPTLGVAATEPYTTKQCVFSAGLNQASAGCLLCQTSTLSGDSDTGASLSSNEYSCWRSPASSTPLTATATASPVIMSPSLNSHVSTFSSLIRPTLQSVIHSPWSPVHVKNQSQTHKSVPSSGSSSTAESRVLSPVCVSPTASIHTALTTCPNSPPAKESSSRGFKSSHFAVSSGSVTFPAHSISSSVDSKNVFSLPDADYFSTRSSWSSNTGAVVIDDPVVHRTPTPLLPPLITDIQPGKPVERSQTQPVLVPNGLTSSSGLQSPPLVSPKPQYPWAQSLPGSSTAVYSQTAMTDARSAGRPSLLRAQSESTQATECPFSARQAGNTSSMLFYGNGDLVAKINELEDRWRNRLGHSNVFFKHPYLPEVVSTGSAQTLFNDWAEFRSDFRWNHLSLLSADQPRRDTVGPQVVGKWHEIDRLWCEAYERTWAAVPFPERSALPLSSDQIGCEENIVREQLMRQALLQQGSHRMPMGPDQTVVGLMDRADPKAADLVPSPVAPAPTRAVSRRTSRSKPWSSSRTAPQSPRKMSLSNPATPAMTTTTGGVARGQLVIQTVGTMPPGSATVPSSPVGSSRTATSATAGTGPSFWGSFVPLRVPFMDALLRIRNRKNVR